MTLVKCIGKRKKSEFVIFSYYVHTSGASYPVRCGHHL